MFRAIGIVLIIWFLSTQFSSTFSALDNAATATLNTVETAAILSQENMEKIK